jgi:hypothetical protein
MSDGFSKSSLMFQSCFLSSLNFINNKSLHILLYLTSLPHFTVHVTPRTFFLKCWVDCVISLLRIFEWFPASHYLKNRVNCINIKGKVLMNWSTFVAAASTCAHKPPLHSASSWFRCPKLPFLPPGISSIPDHYCPTLEDMSTKFIKPLSETYQGIPK